MMKITAYLEGTNARSGVRVPVRCPGKSTFNFMWNDVTRRHEYTWDSAAAYNHDAPALLGRSGAMAASLAVIVIVQEEEPAAPAAAAEQPAPAPSPAPEEPKKRKSAP